MTVIKVCHKLLIDEFGALKLFLGCVVMLESKETSVESPAYWGFSSTIIDDLIDPRSKGRQARKPSSLTATKDHLHLLWRFDHLGQGGPSLVA